MIRSNQFAINVFISCKFFVFSILKAKTNRTTIEIFTRGLAAIIITVHQAYILFSEHFYSFIEAYLKSIDEWYFSNCTRFC